MSMDDVVRLIEREETTIAIVENLLRELDLPVEKIASLANTTVELVAEVKNDLGIK